MPVPMTHAGIRQFEQLATRQKRPGHRVADATCGRHRRRGRRPQHARRPEVCAILEDGPGLDDIHLSIIRPFSFFQYVLATLVATGAK